ncbi:MAG: hypothetical protein COT00_05115 [Candidatus Omnitrophica bacterium CG07_land_8_20_14_0_80_50_8]|nr:MAG: hypothetical protein AUJ71_03385 [Candidatus Omnitrophica bacterium CG1_02_49_16]PIU39787.1 MAG: hypothetical protein COT00_05115 [Candidatus Omnitrophica bacterium CG07_land_8_20_14_0_80_50_8]
MSSGLNRLTDLEKPATEDARLKRIQTALKRYDARPDALIEILHIVEESYGYVPLWMMALLAKEMKVPPSRIYGVVTFYHFFSLKPKGEHTCVVCTGTACHVRGSQRVLNDIEDEFSVRAGETTPDGKLGLQTARCLGCCSLGPVTVIDNEIIPKSEPEKIVALIHEKAGI